MTFEELVATLPVNGRGARVTWAYQYYVQHDPDGVVRLKNSQEPELIGVDWSKRTGYDRGATDYVVLTGQLYCLMLESIVAYYGKGTGDALRIELNQKLNYVLEVSVESNPPQYWDIVPTRDHQLNIHRHPTYPGALPVSSIDIARVRANQVGH